jgi:CHAT domain-containing protein
VDETAPELILNFYRQVAKGQNTALALATAQRTARLQGMHVNQWSGFCCVGQP